jgi:Beta-propeller repeat
MYRMIKCIFTSVILVSPLLAVAAPTLDYATYLGGSGEDSPAAIARDPVGNIYAAGSTNSRDLPGLNGSTFPATLHGDQSLCFVSRLSPDGAKLDFSTILPFPKPTLEPLIGASRLDRNTPTVNGECRVTAISTDLWGTLYVAGLTTLVDTADANHPVALPPGNALGFVQKFQPRTLGDPAGPGLTLQWSKLFGDIPVSAGDSRHPITSVTAINALTVTPGGDVVVAGSTSSNFYPVTTGPVAGGGAYQTSLSGERAGVVTVLDHAGNVLASTYLGVQDTDDHESSVSLSSVAIDSAGNILVGGSFNHLDRLWYEWTDAFLTSNKFPITANAYMPIELSEVLTLNGMAGLTDAVMTKFDPELSDVQYSVVDSGTGTCAASSPLRIYHTTGEKVAVDSNDNMYLLMLTNAFCIETTEQAVQKGLSGLRDAVLLKVTPDGYAKATAKPAFAYQSYVGFGPDSLTNHCILSVAPGLDTDVPDNIYIACNVINARRKSLSNFALSKIPQEDISSTDAQPIFSGENLFLMRLETSDKASGITYTAGFGSTYANVVSDMTLNAAAGTLYFAGSTLGADFPVATDAYDRYGSTQRDGVIGIMSITP